MPIDKGRTLLYMEREWGTYVERFNRLPEDEQVRRVNEQGYESFRDMLAHILAWWDEGMRIILAIAEERPFERKKYDFDVFNAEAVARYKSWDEAEFMAHFEKTRQKMESDLKRCPERVEGSMNEAVFENRRVKSWIRGIVILHAREHLVALSRFMVMDMLENEWGTYIEDFNRLDDEQKSEFLSKQGFESFHDLLAHVVGWWEEGARIITGILDSPGFTWQSHDVDVFNEELIKKFAAWSDDDLFKHYETVRLALLELTARLPDDAFSNKDIEGWLKDDVITHYDEHPMPA
ncbi:MAG: ClbS/DfsB family four-helix bundle protein [Anaerolineae bacterium]|nr:ClbS/DfsB family four-helix bundle protein [Anaerolineae bacterium]MCI0609616.1 ClbS/DfsB family four-helix bundle protein [Anaerolineae bacterium]